MTFVILGKFLCFYMRNKTFLDMLWCLNSSHWGCISILTIRFSSLHSAISSRCTNLYVTFYFVNLLLYSFVHCKGQLTFVRLMVAFVFRGGVEFCRNWSVLPWQSHQIHGASIGRHNQYLRDNSISINAFHQLHKTSFLQHNTRYI